MSATPESPASTIPGIGGMTRNGQVTTGMAETLLSRSGNHENPPSDDSPTIVATSPQKGPPSPVAPMQDRNRPYDPQPPSHPRNDRQLHRDERNRRDSYSRPYDRNARNGDDGWRAPAQRPYKQPYTNQPRQPFVKAEEVPISLSDLDPRGPTTSNALPIPESASSHIHTRNGNNGLSDERARFDDVSSSIAPGRGAPHSDLAGQRLQVDSEQSARPLAPPDSDFKFKPDHGFPPRSDREPVFSSATDQGHRSAGLPLDPNRIPPTNKDSRYPARQTEKYRPGSPGITTNNGLPRSYSNRDRDDFRGPPPKGQPHRDYRPVPRDLSRERDYRPAVDIIDVRSPRQPVPNWPVIDNGKSTTVFRLPLVPTLMLVTTLIEDLVDHLRLAGVLLPVIGIRRSHSQLLDRILDGKTILTTTDLETGILLLTEVVTIPRPLGEDGRAGQNETRTEVRRHLMTVICLLLPSPQEISIAADKAQRPHPLRTGQAMVHEHVDSKVRAPCGTDLL
ncbi:hypothetical protein MD484_g5135, partial [Candolleomyces efflorescens]